MHEISLMQQALEMVQARATAAGATRVTSVVIRVGPFSGVVPDALQFAFEGLTPGTLAQGATLRIEDAPATGHCAGCGGVFATTDVVGNCPVCDSPAVDRRGGMEFELTAIEVNDDV